MGGRHKILERDGEGAHEKCPLSQTIRSDSSPKVGAENLIPPFERGSASLDVTERVALSVRPSGLTAPPKGEPRILPFPLGEVARR